MMTWKVLLALTLTFSQSDINIIYNSPQSYATLEACQIAVDGDDVELDAWITAKTEEFLAIPVEGAKKDLTFYCFEVMDDAQPI